MPDTLQSSDAFHVRAAEGWLGLSSPHEAAAELQNILPHLRAHPDVLKVQWKIQAASNDWQAAIDTATELTHRAPDDPVGWFNLSCALHRSRRTAEARDNLLLVVDKFPVSATMRYNLACFECQLGRLEQAREWLVKAFEVGPVRQISSAVRNDPDLEPLRRDLKLSL